MDHKTMARGCPWRVMIRYEWGCRALLNCANDYRCSEMNCGALYIADLLINELRAEILGGSNENATSTAASSGGDES